MLNPTDHYVFVRGEDWEGVYVNGELADQHHELGEFRDALLLLFGVEIIDLTKNQDIRCSEEGGLPNALDELRSDAWTRISTDEPF